jgi:putative ABC transport system substrate-binding protein
MLDVKRRHFIKLLGSAAAWPLAARAQQAGRVRRVGVLVAAYTQHDREGQVRIGALIDTLQRLGWADGRNLRIDYRWAAGDADRGKNFAADLVRSLPEVMVANSNPVLVELHRLTSTVPQVSDPVGSGIVAGFARPGGNITGFINFEDAMGGKWLGVLKEASPSMKRVAVLFGSDAPATVAFLRVAETIAPSLGVQVTSIDVRDGVEIERAIAAFAGQPDGGLIVTWIDHFVGSRASLAGVPVFGNGGRADVLRARSDRSMARGGNLR